MFNLIFETMTKVQFYREANGQVLAYFPDQKHDDKGMVFYNHNFYSISYIRTLLGQHSEYGKEYPEMCKPATRLEFEPLLEELESEGYQDLKVIIPTKKAYMELLRCDPYRSIGNGAPTIWCCYYDWDPGVYGERSAGYKFACYAPGVTKSLLVKQFYEYLFVTGVRPDYGHLRVAETDEQRFKVAISLNW